MDTPLTPLASEQAKRLGLVTIDQMVKTLVHAVENPAEGIRVVEVPDIRLRFVVIASLVF